MKKKSVLFLVFFFISFCSLGQLITPGPMHVGIFVGASNYTGDLAESVVDVAYTKPSLGIIFRQDFGKWGIRAGLQWGRIAGADSTAYDTLRRARNLSFQSHILEANLLIEWHFWNILEKRYSPYVFAGIAGFYFNPTAKAKDGKLISLRSLGTEGQGLPEYPNRKMYSLIQIAFPLGMGVRYMVTDRITLGLELGGRKIFTDYLDDVGSTYVDPATLFKTRGQATVDMSYRGNERTKVGNNTKKSLYPMAGKARGDNKNRKDWYYFSGITVTYRFNGKRPSWRARQLLGCPSF